jgi:hypothetical protein
VSLRLNRILGLSVDRASDFRSGSRDRELARSPAWNGEGKLPGLRFMRTLGSAMPDREKQEILAAIVARKAEVINPHR